MKTRHLATAGLTVALGLFGTGIAAAETTDVPALSHEAAAGDSATADITVTSSEALAGEALTVLIMNDDAESTDPTTDDVVFIEQYELNEAGGTDFAVQLPTDVLEDYDIALNTAAGTDRYVAPLAGEADPGEDATDDPDEPGEELTPDPGASEGPGDEPTTDPDESGGQDDEPTTGPDESDGEGSGAGDGTDADSGDGSDASDDSDASGAGADGTDQSASGEQSSDGFLASTGASITVAVLIGLIAIGLGVLLVRHRRNSAASQEL